MGFILLFPHLCLSLKFLRRKKLEIFTLSHTDMIRMLKRYS